MIVSRFRSVGWVGCVAFAALGCYLVSQRVASERASVAALDRRIVMARIDIRKLQTEMVTRSRMPVLERWNQEVLALSAPIASQYLHGEVQLASFEQRAVPPQIIPVVARAADSVTQRPATMDTAPVLATADQPMVTADATPMLRHANYVKPADGELGAMPRRVALLDDGVLTDLKQTAKRETRGKSPPQ